MKLQKISTIAAAITLGFGLLGVQAHAKETPSLQKVTIGLGSQVLNVTYPWLMMPVALGYWKQEGYDVNVIGVSGSGQALQQMATGGLDFAQLNSINLVQASFDNRIPVKGVMGNGVIDWGMGVPEGSQLRSIQDLKGKKIGIVSLATGGYPLLKGVLKANGLDPDKDVQIIAVGAGAPALDALNNDRVQALMFWGSALVGFENAGTKLRVIKPEEWMQYPDFTLSTLDKTIQRDPKMVEAIVRGAVKATVFAMANPACVREIHWKKFPSTKPTGADEATLAKWDLALLQGQLKSMEQAFKINGAELVGNLKPEAYQKFQDFLTQEKLVKNMNGKPADYLVQDAEFFRKVNAFDKAAVIHQAKDCKLEG